MGTPNSRELYARLGLAPGAGRRQVDAAHRELIDFLEQAPDGLGRWATGEIASANEARALLSERRGGAPVRRRLRLRRFALAAATLAATVGVVVAVYNMGGGGAEADPASGGATEGQRLSPADRPRVSRLIARLDADPGDVASLLALGDIYFKAGDYARAGGWMEQALSLEPDNVKARLALGASYFNLGEAATARRQWLRVIELDRSNVEAHYDLGFLYASRKPPDLEQAERMWRRVVELAPGTEVAKTVSTHLKGLRR